MAAENYHLKWDSHLSYLNSSVATLYKNEKFADVVLYSSSSICGAGSAADGSSGGGGGIPTVGISAHKFILSSCSQFFATMFETAPLTAPNGVLYVVLPPDLSHRAIQILVQYIYLGEATVSNDILNEVLRGGELLKIRGLCRTPSAAVPHQHQHLHHPHQQQQQQQQQHQQQHQHQHQHQQQHQQQQQRERESAGGYGAASSSRPPPTLPPPLPPALPPNVTHGQQHDAPQPLYGAGGGSNKCALKARHYTIEPQQAGQFRGLGASVMPKDSPVIVKSPKLAQMGLLPAASGSKHLAGAGGGSVGGISINKEVAIDPSAEEKCCYQLNTLEAPPPLCRELGCPLTVAGAESEHVVVARPHRRLRRRSDEYAQSPHMQLALEREYVEQPSPPSPLPPPPGPDEHLGGLGYERRLRRSSSGGGGGEFYTSLPPERYDPPRPHAHSKRQQPAFVEAAVPALPASPPLPHNFLHTIIKQEPTDWTAGGVAPVPPLGASELHHPAASQSPKQQPLDYKMMLLPGGGGGATVKIEAASSAHSADEEELLEAAAAAVAQQRRSLSDDYASHCGGKRRDSPAKPSSWAHHLEAAHSSEAAAALLGGQTARGGLPAAAVTNGADPDALTKSYVPKKRRRVSQQQENSLDHVTLLCDLCSTSFETPAEWVRHMNSQHTEIELAMFNSKKDSEHKHSASMSLQLQQQPQQLSHKKYGTRSHSLGFATEPHAHPGRTCDVCQKRFSSHNNMLLHRRGCHLAGAHNGAADGDDDNLHNASLAGSPVRQLADDADEMRRHASPAPA